MLTTKKILKKDLDWAKKIRRELHKNPELSFKEKFTSKYCSDIMQSLGYKVKQLYGYGFIADLFLNKKKSIGWRTDMDALALEEKNSHEFVSNNKGIAHMCGHDVHMAIALLSAKALADNKENLKNNVRFIFQPAEETPPGGARPMIANGCLEGIDEVYALHVDATLEVGKIRIKKGTITAITVMFDIKVIGKGTHAATPHLGLDPLFIVSRLVCAWQAIISKNISPLHSCVLSITQFHAGSTNNVIPDDANISGTIRCLDEKDIHKIIKCMKEDLEGLKQKGYDYEFICNLENSYDCTINTKEGTTKVIDSAEKIIGKDNVDTEFEVNVCGEDVGYYFKDRQGAFFFLGARNAKKNIVEPSHSPRFDVDEDCIGIGASIALEILS